MTMDGVIGGVLRRLYRQVLDLEESPTGTSLPAPRDSRPYMLYMHVPYCVVLCPFCSFHRVEFKRDKAAGYFDYLRREIEMVTEQGYRFDELYVGGGTPTVMPEELARTLGRLRDLHPLDGVSVETNPDHLQRDHLYRLRDAGVNRLSVGVQSFDDELLKQMQRYEKYGSGAEIRERLTAAHGIFDTLNVDLIFNLPNQTRAALERDLDILIDGISVDQVSFYPLMTVDSTRRNMRRTVGEVDYSRERALYEIIARRMLDAGYTRTSAWCFSRKTGMFDEYIAEREQYVGLGSGAFSYLDGSLYVSTFSLNHYGRLVESGRTATVCQRRMSPRDQMRYYLMMQLFSGRLDKAAADARFGRRFARGVWAELAALKSLRAIRDSGGRLHLTERGYYLWVMMMREFFTGVNTLREQMRHRISGELELVQAR